MLKKIWNWIFKRKEEYIEQPFRVEDYHASIIYGSWRCTECNMIQHPFSTICLQCYKPEHKKENKVTWQYLPY